ncbi:MAG: hypothetical protein Q9162_001390 [Coniocarpon cinnabarinum]
MSTTSPISQTDLAKRTSSHLKTLAQSSLLQPNTAAYLGHEHLSHQQPNPRKRKRNTTRATSRSAASSETAPPAFTPSSGAYAQKWCHHCGYPLIPGWSVTTRYETIPSSKDTRAAKRGLKEPRKSKRRKPEWGPKPDTVHATKATDKDGVWFQDLELKREFQTAGEQGEKWAGVMKDVMARWDQERTEDETSKQATHQEKNEVMSERVQRTTKRIPDAKKRKILRCEHCNTTTRLPLHQPAIATSTPAPMHKAHDTAPPNREAVTQTLEAEKPKQSSRVDAKTQSAAGKAKARAKLRKQNMLAGLVAKSKAADAEQRGSGLGLMDFMKKNG